jgi:hypothetical protein
VTPQEVRVQVMVLFKKTGKTLEQVKADDDSGTDRNAQFSVDLQAGQPYVLRTRLYHSASKGNVGVLYW